MASRSSNGCIEGFYAQCSWLLLDLCYVVDPCWYRRSPHLIYLRVFSLNILSRPDYYVFFSFYFSPTHLIRVWFRWLDMFCLSDFAVMFVLFRSRPSVVISADNPFCLYVHCDIPLCYCSFWYSSLLYVHCDIALCYAISFMLSLVFMSMFASHWYLFGSYWSVIWYPSYWFLTNLCPCLCYCLIVFLLLMSLIGCYAIVISLPLLSYSISYWYSFWYLFGSIAMSSWYFNLISVPYWFDLYCLRASHIIPIS